MNVYWEMTQACALACRHCRAEAAPDPHPGELVKLKGRCTGFLMDVNLADCVLSK